jgi:hypothetical protein
MSEQTETCKRYNESEKGRARRIRYNKSAKGRASSRKYQENGHRQHANEKWRCEHKPLTTMMLWRFIIGR